MVRRRNVLGYMRIHFNVLFNRPEHVEIEMALSPPAPRTPPPPITPPLPVVVVHDPDEQQQQIEKMDPTAATATGTTFAHVFGLNFVSPGIPVTNPHHPPPSQFFSSCGSPTRVPTPRKPSPYKPLQQQQQQEQTLPHFTYAPAGVGLQYPNPLGEQQQRGGVSYFDRVDRPRFPWIVPTLVLIHVTIFSITMYENNCPETSGRPDKCVLQFLNRLSFQPLSENPLLGPSYRSLLLMGALESNLVTKGGQGWRLLSCVWLHAGLFHLFANMTGLLSLGIRLERDFGGLRVGIIYVMAGFGGSMLSALFMQNQISVGASGALMGLLGATVAEIIINWSTYSHRNRSMASLVLAMTLTFSFGLMPHVDNFAHIGGFLAGALWGFIFLMRPRFAWIKQRCCFPMVIHDDDAIGGGEGGAGGSLSRYSPHPSFNNLRNSGSISNMKHTRLQIVIWSLALAFLLLGYTACLLVLFKGLALDSRRTCRWCHYMSCVPSYLWHCRSSIDQHCSVVKSHIQGSLRLLCFKTNHFKDWPGSLNSTDFEIRALCAQTCSANSGSGSRLN